MSVGEGEAEEEEEGLLVPPSSVGPPLVHVVSPVDPALDLLGSAIQALMCPDQAQRARNVL